MMKGQKGLSALVIVIIVAVIVAALLLVVLMFPGDKTEPVDEPVTTEPIGTEQPPPESVMIPMENLPAEYIEFLEQAFPDLIEYYSESGVPIELVWELERMLE